MSQSSTVIFTELHSEEVQDIIGNPPNWLLRWGTTLFFGLLLVLVTSCWLIKYPDIIAAPFTLTAVNAPRTVVVRSEGKLERLLVSDGQLIQKGQIIAYSESIADHEQVLKLVKDIEIFGRTVERNQWSAVNDLHVRNYTKLGEIQNDFQTFSQKLAELKSFLNGGFYLQKRTLLTKDLVDLNEMENNLSEQMDLQKLDLNLGQEEYNVQEKLHRDRVIAPLELKREKAKLLAREMPLKTLASSIIQNRSSQTAKQKEILELDNEITEHKNGFQQSLRTLQSSLETWKQRYLLIAPVSGSVSFSAPWQEQQHLTIGQEFLNIEPAAESYQGLAKIPQSNLGKLRVGQTVLIKLDSYPYREYGVVEGILSKLSDTPGRDSVYWAYVGLPHQLKTRYGRDLAYRNGLKGTAEIITADLRLAERFFSAIRNGSR